MFQFSEILAMIQPCAVAKLAEPYGALLLLYCEQELLNGYLV